LLLYTDGITEARRGDDFFGQDRLEDLLAQYADYRPTRIVQYLYRDARAFSGGVLHDDVALLCLKARE
jgi:sigma-B regulation protein RsbU (phosphoserine phosphatase)